MKNFQEIKMAYGGARQGAGRKKGAPNKITAEAQKKAAETGIMPLDYMLEMLRNESLPAEDRFEAAKAAAPYVHAKLSSVEQKTEVTMSNVVALPPRSETTDQWQASVKTSH